MGLLQDIADGATSSTTPVADILRQCRVLAMRLNHAELAEWARAELNGYDDKGPHPDYRVIATPISKGTFLGAFGRQGANLPVPLFALPDEVQKMVRFTQFPQPISALVELAKNDGHLRRDWPPELVTLYGHTFYEDSNAINIQVIIPPGTFTGIIDTVRSRVLEFVLTLEEKFPEAASITSSSSVAVPPQALHQVFTMTINGNALVGTSGGVASIDNSDPQVTITPKKATDLAQLVERARNELETLPPEKKASATALLDDADAAVTKKKMTLTKAAQISSDLSKIVSAGGHAWPHMLALYHFLSHLT